VGFVIDEERRELVSFTPSDFLARLSSDELAQYSAICSQGAVEAIQQLYKFMRLHQGLAVGRRIAVSNGFYQHYKDVLEKPEKMFNKEVTDFAIHRTAFNPLDDEPVIPGSSMKGAIRTAVLNFRNKEKTFPHFTGRNGNRDLQKHLLGGTFAHDPFSRLKISDFTPVGEVKRTIKYAASFSKKDGEKKLHQMQEIIEPGCSFWGSITILPETAAIGRHAITPQEIIESLRTFYGDEKKREDSELRAINCFPVDFKKEQVIPLRLGKHSGAECITVKGHRHIKISPPGNPMKFSKPDGGATTIWLASDSRNPRSPEGLAAMGWVLLAPLSGPEQKKLRKRRQQRQAERNDRLAREQKEQEQLREIKRQKAREEEEKKLLRDKQAAKAKAAREAEALQWQQMSKQEQELAIVRGDAIAQHQAPDQQPMKDIWPELENAEPEHQKNLARAFYGIWQERPERWRKKACAPGQWKKVEQVVELLGCTHPDILQVTAEEQELLATIESLPDWGQFKNAGIDFADLSLHPAELLAKRFKNDWGCANKKAKKDKKQAWKELKKVLAGLRKKSGTAG